MLTTSTGLQNPADKMCASCNVWERSGSKGGNPYVTVCYHFTLYFAHFSIFWLSFAGFSMFAPVLYWKNIPFHDFLHFFPPRNLWLAQFCHDDTFPLLYPIFPPENFCFSPLLNQFCSSQRAPKHQFCSFFCAAIFFTMILFHCFV